MMNPRDKMPMCKSFAIKAYLDIPHHFKITTDTTVEELEKLIRNDFMVCGTLP
jgi:hypothetical protein